MKKQLVCFLIFLLSISSMFAQFGMKKKVKNATLLKERILLVPVETSEFGEQLKAAVQKVWTYNKDIRFITEGELKTFRKNKKERKNYAVLDYLDAGLHTNDLGDVIKIGFLDNSYPVHALMISSVDTDSESFSKIEKKDINEADLLFYVRQLQEQLINLTKYKKMSRIKIAKKIQKINADGIKTLKTKTLLIEKNALTKKALKEFKANYKYDYKIVSKEVIDDAIINSYDDKLYIKGIAQVSGKLDDRVGVLPNDRNDHIVKIVTYAIYDSATNDVAYTFLSMRIKLSQKDVKNFLKDIR